MPSRGSARLGYAGGMLLLPPSLLP